MKPGQDTIRRRLRRLRGKPGPYWAGIESIAPSDQLLKIIRSKPGKYCALDLPQPIVLSNSAIGFAARSAPWSVA
ncbi:MAG TPA: hypothetical protein VNE82_15640 [Candidatus Binataceae bacterium]|nr:hypothetical protein [Candidatus Binataceae bacterium]